MVKHGKTYYIYFSSFMIVTINGIACLIFTKLAHFERNKTLNDDVKYSFDKITLMQFTLIAIMPTVVFSDLLNYNIPN